MGTSEKREDQHSSNLRKRQKTFAARVSLGAISPHMSRLMVEITNRLSCQGHTRASSQAGQTICYCYHQPRHMRRDCPQRQGSQGFGTAQSQASVGHALTQFIPASPSTGQRNQYQSHGAA